MSGLSPAERIALGMIESTDLFGKVDHNAVAANAADLMSRFQGVSAASMARILMTASIGLETAILSSDDPGRQLEACKAYCVELQILASAVTRKERGLPPLGANGTKADDAPPAEADD